MDAVVTTYVYFIMTTNHHPAPTGGFQRAVGFDQAELVGVSCICLVQKTGGFVSADPARKSQTSSHFGFNIPSRLANLLCFFHKSLNAREPGVVFLKYTRGFRSRLQHHTVTPFLDGIRHTHGLCCFASSCSECQT